MIFVITTLKGYIVSVACVIENMEHGQKSCESVSHFSAALVGGSLNVLLVFETELSVSLRSEYVANRLVCMTFSLTKSEGKSVYCCCKQPHLQAI